MGIGLKRGGNLNGRGADREACARRKKMKEGMEDNKAQGFYFCPTRWPAHRC